MVVVTLSLTVAAVLVLARVSRIGARRRSWEWLGDPSGDRSRGR